MLLNETMKVTGLSKKAIQYYEDKGLITPIRLENGYREYTEETIELLHDIAFLRALAFEIQDIQIILQGNYHDDIYTRAISRIDEMTNRIQQQKLILQKLRKANSIQIEKQEETIEYPYFYTKRVHMMYGCIHLVCFLLMGALALLVPFPAMPSLLLPSACLLGFDLFFENALFYQSQPYIRHVAFKEKHLLLLFCISILRALVLVTMLISVFALQNVLLKLLCLLWTGYALWSCFQPIWQHKK